LVAGEAGMQFYAGVPLRTPDGYNLGTLCVLDTEPREFSGDDTRTLEHLAAIVMNDLELRLQTRRSIAVG
ncbi:MAG: serine/threonine protein kinase, partial [Pseudarthrobacter sp.]|nr:serine/threonine protein kinase [Pseudarthrobacter sp.]